MTEQVPVKKENGSRAKFCPSAAGKRILARKRNATAKRWPEPCFRAGN
jgi:hypothetical protein